MILRREVELPRLTDLAHFDIGGLVATLRHRCMQRVSSLAATSSSC
jgi:hypothetical protein